MVPAMISPVNPAPAVSEHCPSRNTARWVLGGLIASGISLKQAMGRLLRPEPCRAVAISSAGAQLCRFGYCSQTRQAQDGQEELLSLQSQPVGWIPQTTNKKIRKKPPVNIP